MGVRLSESFGRTSDLTSLIKRIRGAFLGCGGAVF